MTEEHSLSAFPLHVVLGAGPLARATAEALSGKGLRVKIISRSGTAVPLAQVEAVRGDIADRAAMALHLAHAQAVYFCAQPPYHRWPDNFPILQAQAIDAASDAGARLVVADNLYGHGPVDRPMHEDMPLRPLTVKGRVRAAMHESLMETSARRGLTVAVARGSDFFGPHVEGSVVGRRAMTALAAGRVVAVAGNPDRPHAYTYVRDFGAALAILGLQPTLAHVIWHVPNAETVTTRRFLEIGARLAGPALRLRRMGRLEMRIIGLFIPAVRETIEMLYEFEMPFLVDDTRFKSAFGDISTPLEAALAETLSWLESVATKR